MNFLRKYFCRLSQSEAQSVRGTKQKQNRYNEVLNKYRSSDPGFVKMEKRKSQIDRKLKFLSRMDEMKAEYKMRVEEERREDGKKKQLIQYSLISLLITDCLSPDFFRIKR